MIVLAAGAIFVGALLLWTGLRNYKTGAALTGRVVNA